MFYVSMFPVLLKGGIFIIRSEFEVCSDRLWHLFSGLLVRSCSLLGPVIPFTGLCSITILDPCLSRFFSFGISPFLGFELVTFEHPVGLALCGLRTCAPQVFFPVLLFNIRRFSSGMLSLRVGLTLVPGVSFLPLVLGD